METIINSPTFGEIKFTYVDTGFGSYCRTVRASTLGQPETSVTFRPAKEGNDMLAEFALRWTRADGKKSPGIRVAAADYARIMADKRTAEAAVGSAHRPTNDIPNAQIWD